MSTESFEQNVRKNLESVIVNHELIQITTAAGNAYVIDAELLEEYIDEPQILRGLQDIASGKSCDGKDFLQAKLDKYATV